MKYTVYGIIFESNYCFNYFHLCSDLLPTDIYVEVNIHPNAVIPPMQNWGEDWFEISQPDEVMYRYSNKKLYILAKKDSCIKSTISTIPFFMPVTQKGGVLFHAACVLSSSNRKVAIIAAPSGVGKSTIAAYLSTQYKDSFRIISDDAIAVYLQKETFYVYNGPAFSKIDATTAELIEATVSEKNFDNSKFLISHDCDMSKIYSNIEELRFELGAFFFIVAVPISERFQIRELDYRSKAIFFNTSIVANRYNLADVNNILFDRAELIGNKIPSYILYYPQKLESLNIQLYKDIYEKI